jgi:hypothetical protein
MAHDARLPRAGDVVEIDPATGACAHDAKQTQARRRDASRHVGFIDAQVGPLRVALRESATSRQFPVV